MAVSNHAKGLRPLGPGQPPLWLHASSSRPRDRAGDTPHGAGAVGGCCCRACPFLLERHSLTQPCVTARHGDRPPVPLSDGSPGHRLFSHPRVLHPADKCPRQFKQGRCVGDAQPGRVWGLSGCHPLARDMGNTHSLALAAGMLQLGPGQLPPGLIPTSPPKASWGWASRNPCLVPVSGCSLP